MRQLLPLALALATGLSAADNGKPDATMRARLSSYQEVPAVSSAASGSIKLKIDWSSKSFSYELSYEGLEGTATMAHIHLGQMGANGGVMVWLCQSATNADPTGLAPACPQTAGTVSGLIQAANVVGPAGQGVAAAEMAELLEALRAGVTYVNVHSSKFPGGEIRGQLGRGHRD
jgi:hypothetical protein